MHGRGVLLSHFDCFVYAEHLEMVRMCVGVGVNVWDVDVFVCVCACVCL